MIESPVVYITLLIALAGGFWRIERYRRPMMFRWLPPVVLIYLLAIAAAQGGLFAQTPAQGEAYRTLKSYLLPMMLFLMLLQLDLAAFARLGRKLLMAYAAAVGSLAFAFIAVFALFDFDAVDAGVFGALCGSWTGGTANMLAVASALQLPEAQLGPALVVDALLYSLWVSVLLLSVPFAHRFDRWACAEAVSFGAGRQKPPPLTPLRTALLVLLSILIAFAVARLSTTLPIFPASTWSVLLATLLGVAASFTPLRRLGDSSIPGGALLYLLIALVGSHASFSGLGALPHYLLAGSLILGLHALVMVMIARRFRLNLFTLGIASLSNIGGVASAPLLAAAYHRHLVGAAVLMAVTGYLAGTFIGLGVAVILRGMAA